MRIWGFGCRVWRFKVLQSSLVREEDIDAHILVLWLVSIPIFTSSYTAF